MYTPNTRGLEDHDFPIAAAPARGAHMKTLNWGRRWTPVCVGAVGLGVDLLGAALSYFAGPAAAGVLYSTGALLVLAGLALEAECSPGGSLYWTRRIS